MIGRPKCRPELDRHLAWGVARDPTCRNGSTRSRDPGRKSRNGSRDIAQRQVCLSRSLSFLKGTDIHPAVRSLGWDAGLRQAHSARRVDGAKDGDS